MPLSWLRRRPRNWIFLAKAERLVGSIPPVKTTCTHCGARYALPDDQVNPGTRIRCRKCGGKFAPVPRAGAATPGASPHAAPSAAEQVAPAAGSSEASAIFSLAALAQRAVALPVADVEASADSAQIDLRQVGGREAQDATLTPVPTAVPLVPLGINPLGASPVDAALSGGVAPRSAGFPPWALVAGSIAIAVVILGVTFVTRRAPSSSTVPAGLVVTPASVAVPVAEAGPAPTLDQSSPTPSVPTVVSSASIESPPPIPEPTRRPPPDRVAPPPPVQPPSNPCAHCGTDLACSMACRVKG